MTVSESTSFDDLIAQGQTASQAGEATQAIECFEHASAARPTASLPQSLLGAEFAAQGEIAKAEAAFANATRLAPEFPMARFQLGLLQFSSGRAALALLTWQPLLQLPATAPLPHFVQGFAALASDQFQAAQQHFKEGLPLNTSNPPLSKDIAMIIERIRAIAPGDTPSQDDLREHDNAVASAHVLLANYRPQGPAH
jgi:Flp pilus assembly protein TadD